MFRVWAPRAERVEVEIGDERTTLSAAAAANRPGWWYADVPAAEHGTNYAFVLDGGEPLPDPRSAWQPHGVHGPSRVVDHERFRWTDEQWQAVPLSAAVVYEMHVGTFTSQGTFDAAIERLDHLRDLGITHVELMPVNEFPGTRGWGYDGVDLYAPHHVYGGPDGLKRLVNACHKRGLAVLLDVVYNHLGPDGNYLSQFGPYFTDRYTTPWGQAVNLDGPGSDEVRRFFIDNALMWLRDYHIDGLRIDAVHAIVDTSAVHFLEALAAEVRTLEAQTGRHFVLIAESDLNDPRLVRAPEAGGYGIDAQWSDDFHHALHALLTGEREGYYADFGALADVAKSLQRVFVYDGCYSAVRERRHGRPAGGLPGARFLGYLQNHDQVGNRAQGDRSSHLLGLKRLKIGAALVLTAPFVPMLFQGEEWGASTPFQYFTDHQDSDLAQAVSQGRREEFASFGWEPEDVPDPQAPETFERSRLDWSELDKEPHASLLDWHVHLLRLRRQHPDLRAGGLDGLRVRFAVRAVASSRAAHGEADEEGPWLVIYRGRIAIVCNLAERPQELPIENSSDAHILLASNSGVEVRADSVRLPALAVAILDLS